MYINLTDENMINNLPKVKAYLSVHENGNVT